MKKIVSVSGILIASAALAMYYFLVAAPALSGSIINNSGARIPGRYYAGNFVIEFRNSEASGLRMLITHNSDPGRPVFSTIAGKSFIACAAGKETVSEKKGSFFIKDTIGRRLTLQTIDSINSSKNYVTVSGRLKNTDETVRYTLTLEAIEKNQLRFHAVLDNSLFNRIYLTYSSSKDEQFFGFGEQFSFFNFKGKKIPIFNMEQGIGRGAQPITLGADLTAKAGGKWHTTYAGVPHYISSRLRSLFLENSEYSSFDMRDKNSVQVQVFSHEMKGRILNGNSPAGLIFEYTKYSGRMRELPDWILKGAVIGIQGGTEKTLEVHKKLKQRGTPLSAYWLQDWVGQRITSFGRQLWWNWELDGLRYPGWNNLVRRLEKDGARVMIYISPFLTNDIEKKGHYRRNLYGEAIKRGFLVKRRDGSPYLVENTDFSAGLIDITNPGAKKWIKEIIKKEMIGIGASGWMADFGEALPYDARLHSGEPGASYHNRYPEEWALVNREAIREAGVEGETVFFSRAGFTKSPGRSTLFWEGDQLVSWDRHDGIKTAVTGLLTSGLSGYSFNHSDIGGYTAIANPVKNYFRSKELLMRWCELSAFTVVFRTHEGNRPADNHQIYSDDETMDHFSRMAEIFNAWMPYRKKLVKEAALTGMPVIRHPFLHYPEDKNVYSISCRQFMIGADFMFAPVLDENKNSVGIYLPEGVWIHLWSGKVYTAGRNGLSATVEAPIGRPALFYRAGSRDAENFKAALIDKGILPRERI